MGTVAGQRTTPKPEQSPLVPALRVAIGVMAVVNAALAAGYVLRHRWAIQTWPWETGRLSYIFVGSILAAISAGAAWTAISGELGSVPAGTLDLSVMMSGVAAFLLLEWAAPDGSRLLPFALGATALALVNIALFLWTRRFATGHGDRLPSVVYGSYIAFVAILLTVGGALVLGGDVLPWRADHNTGVLIGWIFLGNALYFMYALVKPTWQRSRAQLWSFLAYDVVLVGPLVAHVADVPDDLRANLWIYLAVVFYSAALAVYYLVVEPILRRMRSPAER